MDWCRLWHDAPDDPKWRLIARKAGVRVGDVWAVFTRMLVRASASGERGSIAGWDDEVEAIALDYEPHEVAAIREAMQGRILDGDRLSGWGKRQPKRERPDDNSAERVREHRERQRATGNAGEEPLTPCNATDGTETPRLDESREDSEEIDLSLNSRACGTSPRQQGMSEKQREADAEFERWWLAYPRRVGKGQARKAYQRARAKADVDDLSAAAKRYGDSVTGKDPEFIAHPATWLNGERWLDEPARKLPEPIAGAPPPSPTEYEGSDAKLAEMWNAGKRNLPQFHNPQIMARLRARHTLADDPPASRRTA